LILPKERIEILEGNFSVRCSPEDLDANILGVNIVSSAGILFVLSCTNSYLAGQKFGPKVHFEHGTGVVELAVIPGVQDFLLRCRTLSINKKVRKAIWDGPEVAQINLLIKKIWKNMDLGKNGKNGGIAIRGQTL